MGYLIGISLYVLLAAIPITAMIAALRMKRKFIREQREREIKFAIEMEKLFEIDKLPKEKQDSFRKAFK
ncbi:hypothetical protein [Paenibacillus sp. NAIST15-1]|uniref:hypothetical protein n=1 Tax=Paenibacillus sp. NAIST15-1 TaxID=1605994 RepID=UPI00086C64CD|nr:hypothetical protein [Paenibacillus sp. NAIST15-1]GAV11373.1 hypothetical protein PBN151_1300 [Paenibacillus sp. NAIST15-1]